MPRAWLTPDSPAPESERCRRIVTPDELAFVAAVTGALLPLTSPDNWEQAGSMTPQEAADIMSAAFELFVSSDCDSECPAFELPSGDKIWRRNPTTGNFEYLDDTGESWVEPDGENAIPEPEAREELTSDERKCAAATNAAHVLDLLYHDCLEDFNNNLDTYQMATNLSAGVASRIAAVFYAPVAGMIAGALAAFNFFVELFQALAVDLWDDTFTNELICILKENATDTAGVITFDYHAVNQGILETLGNGHYILLVSQVIYLTSIIGEQGLNIAGTTTALEGDCNCDGWCYTFDFSNGSQDWIAVRETIPCVVTAGSFDGTQWNSTLLWDTANAYADNIMIARRFASSNITSVSATFSRTNGQYASGNWAQRWWVDNWDGYVNLGNRATIRTDWSPGGQGTNMTLTSTGTWNDIECIMLTFSASTRGLAVPNPRGTISVTSVTITGTGECPFGLSNCE